ncbi:venom carboxylesterase-6-like [Zootermopsis nevadensis]|uniref:venom carboxylesterase-6-like n=1 Tax=Zootermopsis nevadensis TaxID=136037 RepID=UPI000B8EBA39|nr:venom carboxylesterase-6-like [Zootermopsis nevadensis]
MKEVDSWQPVLETKTASNPEPFLTDSPLKLVQTGDFYKVPWMMGSTSEDGAFFGAALITDNSKLKEFNEHMDVDGPKEFFLDLSLNESLIPETWNRIRDFYFADKNTAHPKELIKLYTDRYVVHAVHKAAELHTKAGHHPIYRYNFAYRGQYSYANLVEFMIISMDLGVVHQDDLIYLIPLPIFNLWLPGHPDLHVIDTMVTLCVNFATYGNPTPSGENSTVTWQPITNGKHSYLNIGHDMSQSAGWYGIRPVKLKMEEYLYKDRMEFWDSLPLVENV